MRIHKFYTVSLITFSALTLLVGWLEEHWPVKIWVRRRCLKQSANDLHIVQLMPLPSWHLLLHWNREWFILLVLAYTACPEKRPLNETLSLIYCVVLYLSIIIALVLSSEYFMQEIRVNSVCHLQKVTTQACVIFADEILSCIDNWALYSSYCVMFDELNLFLLIQCPYIFITSRFFVETAGRIEPVFRPNRLWRLGLMRLLFRPLAGRSSPKWSHSSVSEHLQKLGHLPLELCPKL